MTGTIRKNTFLNLLISLIRYLYPVIAFIYIARVLHPEGLGRVGYAAAFSAYFVMIAELGMPIYGMRVASVRKKELPVLTGELFLIRTIFGLGSCMLFLVLVLLTQNYDRGLFLICGLSIPAAIPECEWLYKGVEDYSVLVWIGTVSRIVGFLTLFFLVKDGSDVYIYAWINVIIGAGITISEFVIADRRWNLQVCRNSFGIIRAGKMGQVVRMHLPALLLFFLMSCAVTIYSHTDTVMLGAIKGTEEVGIYSCAAKVKMVLPVITGSLWAAALPKAADLWQGRDKKTFEKLADSSFHTVQVIITPLVLYFVLFAGPFIGVIGGEEYSASVLPMQMLVLAILPIGVSNIAGGQVLIAAGMERKLFQAEIAGAISNIIMNAAMIPVLSVSGAAIATIMSEVFVAAAAMIHVRRLINTRAFDFGTMRNVLIGCLIASVSVFVLLTEWSDIVKMAVSFVGFFFLYGIVMICLKDELFLDLLKTVRGIYRRILPEKI